MHSSLIPFFSLPGKTRIDGRYQKLLIPPTPANSSTNTIPEGYALTTPLHDADLHTVLNRSPIPRTLSTLRALPSVGLYLSAPANDTNGTNTTGECVGWGFLSKDGSISSLHVEPPHRGQGLATGVAHALLSRQAATFSTARQQGDLQGSNGTAGVNKGHQEEQEKEAEGWWGVVDVEESNAPSQRVMAKLGARVWWGVQWCEINIPVVLKGLEEWE